MSNIFTLNWKQVLGALVSGVIVAVLGYLLKVGDVWAISTPAIINVAVMTGATSLLKAFGSDSTGSFLGIVPTK